MCKSKLLLQHGKRDITAVRTFLHFTRQILPPAPLLLVYLLDTYFSYWRIPFSVLYGMGKCTTVCQDMTSSYSQERCKMYLELSETSLKIKKWIENRTFNIKEPNPLI